MVSPSAWDSLLNSIPAGSTLFAMVHSHPQVNVFQLNHTGGMITSVRPDPDKFSKCDQDFLNTIGPQWPSGFQSDIITGQRHLLVWPFGWSVPSPASAYPDPAATCQAP